MAFTTMCSYGVADLAAVNLVETYDYFRLEK